MRGSDPAGTIGDVAVTAKQEQIGDDADRQRAYTKAYRQTKKGKAARAAAQRRYRAKHPDRIQAQMAAWLAKHPEYERERSRKRYAKDPKRQLAATGRWQRRNVQRVRARVREYHRTENGKATLARMVAKRRAAKKAFSIEAKLTAAEWCDLIAYYDGRCAYCFAKPLRLEKDHVMPISRGGHHVKSNVVPACRICNAEKHDKTPQEWLFPEER